MNEQELKKFENILQDRKVQIEQNLRGVEKELTALRSVEANDEGDAASLSADNVIENAIGSQQNRELEEIIYSLAKIKDGVYGVCEMCEDDIIIARLEVKPHAKYCIDCREIAEKNSNI
ncbi:MAG: RNA polymerase-binding protein DksA [Helicobacteraceae bacterium]|nr:RNA polymerase-binding protein DksA [Helicobacteraceae bacterium]